MREKSHHIRQLLYEKGLLPKLGLFMHILLMILVLSFSLLLILFTLLYWADTKDLINSEGNAMLMITISVLLGSALFSLIMTVVIDKTVLGPMRQVLHTINKVSKGNFDVRISTNDTMEIGLLVDSLNSMIESLGSLEMLRNDFIVNVSHEFKTPLASIQGYAAMLQNEELSAEERRRCAGIVYDSAKRLSALSGNILELSRLEHSDVRIDKTQFMLDEQLRQALLLLQAEWQQKDIELNLELAEVKYFGSDELLMQVWLNLLGNAIKFSPQGGRIDVTLTETEGAAVVAVRDYGIGISPAEQKLIFEKFYQADTSHKTEGNGLGLAMVKRIINLLNADIEVDGAEGEGACFTVTLPVEKPPQP